MTTPSDIHPCLTYADAAAAIEWLCRDFGFEKRLVVEGDDGSIRHSELSLGTGVIMVSSPREDRPAPGKDGRNKAFLSVYVDDPDDHMARAVAAGAKITQPIRDEEYGASGYGIEDLEGHRWYFGNYRPGRYWGNSDGSGEDT